jgi:hypothetical protein
VDLDNDGYGTGDQCRGPDCDDTAAAVHPGAEELCNTVDDDCDGAVDEDFSLTTLERCGACDTECAPPNTVEAACVDGACEVIACPEEFGDCDGDSANGCEAMLRTFFLDGDGDGYGRDDVSMLGCQPDEGYVSERGDCNDLDRDEHPGAREICDDLDNDCDGEVDEVEDLDPPLAMSDTGVCEGLRQVCNGFVFVEPDYVGIEHYEQEEQTCDGRDNDCDGETDEGCPECTVPHRYASVQDAAAAHCTEIYLLDSAPSHVVLVNPPEDVVIRPAADDVAIRFIELRLDQGNPRAILVEGLTTDGFSAINADRRGSIELRGLRVRGVESNAPVGTLAGFHLAVTSSDFAENVVTTGARTGILNISEASEFRLLTNVFRANRVDAENPEAVSGAVYIEGDLSEGLVAGNLFVENEAHGVDGAGALYIAPGVRNVRLWNNTFVRNQNRENVQATAVRCAGSLPGGDFRNNIMWFGPGRHIDGCASASITWSNHENGVPDGEGNLSVDPRFGEDRNYDLAQGSPCINRGDPDVAHQDLDATRNDIGYTGGPYRR